jgi:long-chain fatty acid transport protein
VSGATWSGGFYITEIGTPGSLGTAGASNPTNTITADAAWTNPAGMTGISGDHFLLGTQVVAPEITFDSDVAEAGGNDGGNAGFTSAIPSFFAVKKLSERARAGFSVVAPLGGGVRYSRKFVGRYAAQKAVLSGLSISPAVGYRVNDRLSLGAGLSFIYTRFDENIAVLQPGTEDARVRFDGLDDWGVQGYTGLTFKINDRTLFGAVYRSKSDANPKGDVNFNNFSGPEPSADSVKISWDYPQLLRVGVRHELSEGNFLVADADWEDWSDFSKNQLAFDGGSVNPTAVLDRQWKDTYHVGIGYIRVRAGHVFSAGVGYDSSVVSDKNRTIDLPLDDQLKFSTAYGWESKTGSKFALGATLLYGGEAEVDQTAQGLRFAGDFDRNYILFVGGSLFYPF